MNSNSEENKVKIVHGGNRIFYVKFFVPELEEEFLEVSKNFQERDEFLKVSEKNGIYKAEYTDSYIDPNCSWSTWDIMMHKCLSWSKEIRKDSETGEKYYPVNLSKTAIISVTRRVAV